MTYNEMIAQFKDLVVAGQPMAAMNLVSEYMDENAWGPAEEEEMQRVLTVYPVG